MSSIDKSRVVGMSERDLDEFVCGICHLIFADPVETHCCRQIFCKSCIVQWLSTKDTCPNDRSPLLVPQLIPASRLVVNTLSNIRIKCEFEENGCQTVTTIAEMSDHMEECVFRPNIVCKTCGLLKVFGEEHNCITNLVTKNNSITDELERLRKELEESKKVNEELKRKNESTVSLKSALASVLVWDLPQLRVFAPEPVVEVSINISSSLQKILTTECINAILTKKTCFAIRDHLAIKLISCRNVIIYSSEESVHGLGHFNKETGKYLQISYGKLKIVMFS